MSKGASLKERFQQVKTHRDKIRAICHSLQMLSLANIDETQLVSLKIRIKELPSPEEISSMDTDELKKISTRLEKLIVDINDAKNARTSEKAIQHLIRKGIPPRLEPILAQMNNSWVKDFLKSESQS